MTELAQIVSERCSVIETMTGRPVSDEVRCQVEDAEISRELGRELALAARRDQDADVGSRATVLLSRAAGLAQQALRMAQLEARLAIASAPRDSVASLYGSQRSARR